MTTTMTATKVIHITLAGGKEKNKHLGKIIKANNQLNQTDQISTLKHLIRVDPPAIGPDLALRSRQRRDIPHLDHRLGEVIVEYADVHGVQLHQLPRSRALREQNLVRVEQALANQYVLVVVVVELRGADVVEREEVVVAARSGAAIPELRGVRLVQRAVG